MQYLFEIKYDISLRKTKIQSINPRMISFLNSKVCTPPMCNDEGIYVSEYCQKNGFNECALMITGFPGKNVI